jgi:membrane protease YdiL (CAAX protease family)
MVVASWCFWWPAALLGGGPAGSAGPWTVPLRVLGALVPCLLVALLLARPGEAVGRRRLLRGLLAVTLLRPPHLLVLLLPPGLALLATAVALATELTPAPRWQWPAAGTLLDVLVLRVLVALPEEITWRGFAQERLQGHSGALLAALLVAGLWALWELPLFAVPGTHQAAIGFGTAGFALHLAHLVALAVVLAALYNDTRGSILATTALLGSVRLTTECAQLGPAAELVLVACWSVVALGLLAHSGPATLSSAPAPPRREQRRRHGPRRQRALAADDSPPERTFSPRA